MLWSRGIDSKEPIQLANVALARVCKHLRNPGIDSKEPIPLANVAWARIWKRLKVHKIEIFFGFNFEICIISLLVMSKY